MYVVCQFLRPYHLSMGRTLLSVPQGGSVPKHTDLECAMLTVEQAAKRLGISRGLAYEAARRGDIPAVRIGKRLLVPVAALQTFIERTQRGAA